MEKKKTQIEPERDSESRSAFAQDAFEFVENTTQQMASLVPNACQVCTAKEFRSLIETQNIILRALAGLLELLDTIHQQQTSDSVEPS